MAAAVRSALLRHLRVKANAATAPLLPRADPRPLGGLLGLARRGFSEEARGTFLDKSEVADRVVTVVKNFQKVDPAKACLLFFFFPLFLIGMVIVTGMAFVVTSIAMKH